MASHSSQACRLLLIVCGLVSVSLVWGQSAAAVQVISPNEWKTAAAENQKLLVVFYKKKGCAGCQEMVDAVTALNGSPDLDEDLQIGKSTDVKLAASLGATALPAVVFQRENSYAIYDGKAQAEGLMEWLMLAGSKVTQHLHDDSFEHLTQASTGATTGEWLVAFYQESCQNIIPVMESAGVRIRLRTNVAVVDSSKNKLLADRFSIDKCPQVILFKQGKMYRYDVPVTDQASLVSFVDGWYKNSKAETVFPPKSKFDFLTESIASTIKAQLEGENKNLVLAVAGGSVAFFLLLVFCCCCCRGSSKKQKTE